MLDNVFTDIVSADGTTAGNFGAVTTGDFLDFNPPIRRVKEENTNPADAFIVREDAADPYTAIEIRPNTTTAQRDAGRAAYADVQRRILSLRGQRIGAAVLGSRLAADIATTGGAQLIGQEIRDASDLAMLAQIYRNPNFETWRAFFVKDGKVVGEHAYSSRLPGSVLLPRGIASWLNSQAEKYGADSVFTMHNHPNGTAMPSLGDVAMAAKLRREVPAWRGEIIINSQEFAALTGERAPDSAAEFEGLGARDLAAFGVTLTRDPRLAAVDFNSAPELEHRLLGLQIHGEASIAKIGKGLQVPGGHAAMIVASNGKVQALLDVPVAPLLDTKSKLGRAKIMAMVRRITRATGGDARYMVVPKGVKLDAWLVRFGIFQDIVTETGVSMLATVRKRAGNPDLVPLDQIARNSRSGPRQIYEARAAGYAAAEPGTRRSRAAEPQQAEVVEGFTPERRNAADWARGAIAANRPWMLGALTRDQIVDIWGKDLPQIVDFDRTVQSMDADRASIAQAADEIVERWRRLPSKEADALADVMHAATLAQFDPDVMNAIQPEHDQILADWNGLSDAAQAVYREARDTHRATLQAIRNGLADRAERTGSMGRQIADRIRLDFDKFLRDGVYFPLSRFGDLLLIADRNGERTVEAFESGTQREARVRQLRADGWRVKMTSKSQYSAIRDGAAGAFTQEVMQHLEGLDIDPAQKSQLFDTLNQLAISMLPDASYRRHFKHRKGTPGFSRDAMRGFAQAQQHAAHHIARIRHADQLVAALDDLQAQLSETAEGDVTEWQHVANELVRRLEQILNPNTHPVAAAAGQVGFVMSLGGSIASGLVNLSQTPLVFFPWAGARFGFDKAAAALTKATRDYLGGKWDKWSGFVLSENPNIAPEERDALKHLEESGIINLTLAHDLAGAANADSTVSRRAFALNRAMKVISWTFHLPETYNRQVSAIAAYRLAREAGQTHEEAIETARDGIVRSHFDYSASNRARYMHGNFIRVVTMFKQYSQQMTYMLWRNAWLALKGESAEVKSEARRMLFGVMSMHFAAAGSLGLPLGVLGVSPLLSLLAMGSGDEDDPPLDWQDEYRLWLADTFGRETGEAIAKGPLRLLLDVDLASRFGLGDLWVRAPLKEKEGRDAVEAWMLSLLGPIAGYAGQMGTAMQAFEEGQPMRGVEAMMPKFIAAPLKALRYETEGVRSWRGDDLGVTLSDSDIIGTAMGFQPTALSEMYSARATVKGREAALQRRREDLMRAWREARDAGDSAGLADAVASIQKFNAKNRPFAIGAQHLKASWMAHRRAQLQMAQGINLSRRRDELREFGRFAVID
ncbi:MAG: PLxRFG domain-containing protein [Thauera sp.]|nr:PLxRFG domain-containing protein [Thauera sp.]